MDQNDDAEFHSSLEPHIIIDDDSVSVFMFL